MTPRLHVRPAEFATPSREAMLAGATGAGVGTLAGGVAYAAYLQAGGPTIGGAIIIPLSIIVVAVLRVALARRRQRRASDWVVLGYAAGIVLATLLLTVEQALYGVYSELDRAGW